MRVHQPTERISRTCAQSLGYTSPMATLSVPPGYERLDPAGVRRWLAAQPALSARLGGGPDTWRIDEVSDGNLNVVYVVRGSAGGVCVKQSLPYVRVAGESWPMPLERAYFEQLYLRVSEPHVNGLAPKLLYYDPERFAMAMELLSEHIILRRGLIAGERYPTAARSVAEYTARRAFATSVLAEPFEPVNERLAAFTRNHALLRITVDLIFTHPVCRKRAKSLDHSATRRRGHGITGRRRTQGSGRSAGLPIPDGP